jgi:hypothetical protein
VEDGFLNTLVYGCSNKHIFSRWLLCSPRRWRDGWRAWRRGDATEYLSRNGSSYLSRNGSERVSRPFVPDGRTGTAAPNGDGGHRPGARSVL